MATLEELQARKNKLSREYEAIQAEFSSGKNFTSGAAEADRERREIAKYQEIKDVDQQIRAQTGQISAGGQTAGAASTNTNAGTFAGAGQGNTLSNPSGTPNSQPLSDKQSANLQTNQKNASNDPQTATTTNNSESKTVEEQKIGLFGKYGVGSSQSGESSSTDSKSNQVKAQAPTYNMLHDYTSYTYRITLFLLTSDEYTTIVNTPESFVPKHVLISSGGGFSKSATPTSTTETVSQRHPDFAEDFYFDQLSMTTVVGLNSRSKSSNAIDIKFNIIEPYGMTLLDRLLSACYVTAQCTNYVDQPYLLQIDFLSNVEEAASNNIIITQKRIPIRITEFKIKPSAGGTVYSVRAMPYNHVAYLQSVASVPISLAVEAKTVNEFFDSNAELEKIFDSDAAKREERIESELQKMTVDGLSSPEDEARYRANLEAQFKFQTKSFPAGYNTYFKNLSYDSKLRRFNTPLYQLAFNIHPDIGNSAIIDPKELSSEKTPMTSALSSYFTTMANGNDPKFKDQAVTNIMAGTSVMGVIERVISSSDYIKNQVRNADEEQQKAEQQDTTSEDANARESSTETTKKNIVYKPTDWFKVTSSITLGNYDTKGKAYSKFIVFNIMPYKAVNAYHPDFAFTKVNAKQCVRTYNYYYTGRNQDIISLDIDFDATFITSVTTYLEQASRGGNNIDASATVVGEKEVSDERPPSWLPFSVKPVPVDTGFSGGKASRTPKDISVASVSRSLYSAYPRGDMLNIKMRIVGDPSFIKQDDVYHNPVQANYGNVVKKTNNQGTETPISENGQILFDGEQVFVQLIVKSVSDINDDNGLILKGKKLSNDQIANGSFSGIYRVMTVESIFDNGKFEQIVDLIRMPDDLSETDIEPELPGSTKQATIEQRAENEQLGPPGGTPFTNPRPENVPAVDPKLKEVAASPAVNPSSPSAGAGVPPKSDQPSSASASNANSAGNSDIVPAEKAKDPKAENAAADDKAVELNFKYYDVYNAYKDYVKEWGVRYDVYRNAPEAEKNTAANIQARIDLQKEFVQKTVDVGLNGFLPIANERATIRPITDKVLRLGDNLSAAFEVLADNKKSSETSIDKLTQRLERLNQ